MYKTHGLFEKNYNERKYKIDYVNEMFPNLCAYINEMFTNMLNTNIYVICDVSPLAFNGNRNGFVLFDHAQNIVHDKIVSDLNKNKSKLNFNHIISVTIKPISFPINNHHLWDVTRFKH